MALGVALLAACGGRSIDPSEEDQGDEAAGAPSAGNSPQKPGGSGGDLILGGGEDESTAADLATCERVCSTCGLDEDCSKLCARVYDDARTAGCATAVRSLLRCRKQGNDCAYGTCATENNALSACVIGYCDSHARAPLCTAPI